MPQYSLVSNGDEANVTVFVDGDVLVAHSSHPNFAAIVGLLTTGEGTSDELADLFDASIAAAKKFDRLSERVTVANGHVYLDGDEIHNSLTSAIVRFLSEGVDDWKPLVAFFENVQANPERHSREQLYDWLDAHDFTITTDGSIVGYKGVSSDGNGGWRSGFQGTAIVDGETITGHTPYAVGSTVEMPRGAVAHDPSAACSTGLHVGTYNYAHGYASGALLKVAVNPRDVVSVPTDAAGEKVRVCRLRVLEVIDAPETSVLDDGEWDDWAEADDPAWGGDDF